MLSLPYTLYGPVESGMDEMYVVSKIISGTYLGYNPNLVGVGATQQPSVDSYS